MGTSYQETVDESLVFSQTATVNVVSKKSATSIINFGQTLTSNYKLKLVSHVLETVQAVSVNTFINESVNNNLDFQQVANATKPINLSASSSISFQQNATNVIKVGIASNAISFQQNVTSKQPRQALPENIFNPPDPLEDAEDIDIDLTGMQQSVSVSGVYNKLVTSYLNLSQQATRDLLASASNHISFSQLAEITEWELVNSGIQFNQNIVIYNLSNSANINDPWVTRPISNLLVLSQLADPDLVYTKSISNSISFNQFVDNYIKDYEPCPGTYVKTRSTILLTYPYINPIYTVEVRNPQFDDNRQIENSRILRKTRGGTLKVFRDPIWPSAERLIYSFDNLYTLKKLELLEFFEVSIGKEIGLLDFRSQQWRGIIITPTTQIGREDRPGNSLTFEFEGTIDTGGLQSSLNIFNKLDEMDLTKIPPGFQVDLNVTSSLVGNVIRD